MHDLQGRSAVVTGGGSGIGRALVHAFAAEGMHVIVADIERDAAEAVAGAVRHQDVRALAVPADVADPASLQALADRVAQEFGHVNVLCNNAGVYLAGSLADATREEWGWLLAVNLLGVIEGVRAFLPLLRKAGPGEAQIVNTASGAGLSAAPGIGVYNTTKYAVVGYSESLRRDLAPEGIGVSILCPGGVNTRIFEAGRNRQAQFGGPATTGAPRTTTLPQREPADVAALVVRGIQENRLYLHTDLDLRRWYAQRFARIDADFAPLEAAPTTGA
jgi:NAD(P)-dependent dehydrogenase (short-subunit alcohol dehydrogenase family)